MFAVVSILFLVAACSNDEGQQTLGGTTLEQPVTTDAEEHPETELAEEESTPFTKDLHTLIAEAEKLGFSVSRPVGGSPDEDTGAISRLLFFTASDKSMLTIVPDQLLEREDGASFYVTMPSFEVDGLVGVFEGNRYPVVPLDEQSAGTFYFFEDAEDRNIPQDWDLSEEHFDFILKTLSDLAQDSFEPVTSSISDSLAAHAISRDFSWSAAYQQNTQNAAADDGKFLITFYSSDGERTLTVRETQSGGLGNRSNMYFDVIRRGSRVAHGTLFVYDDSVYSVIDNSFSFSGKSLAAIKAFMDDDLDEFRSLGSQF